MIAKQDQVHWQHLEDWPLELTPAQREQLLRAKVARAVEWVGARAGLVDPLTKRNQHER
jgi:hypothetical protein